MKEKKTEQDLSILETQDTEIEVSEEEVVEVTAENQESETKEKKKIKPWILITSIVLILAIIAVGIFTWYELTTLATYDGGRITKAEFDEALESTMLSQGITEDIMNDPTNAEAVQQFKDELLISVAYDEIFYGQLEKLNIGQLSAEEIAAIEEECQTMLDDYVEANLDNITMGLEAGYTEKDFEKARAEFEMTTLNQIGCLSFQDFVDLRIDEETFMKAYDELVPEEDVAPTDEEVNEEYEKLLDSQKSIYAENPASFLLGRDSLDMELFVPEGIRTVRHVLIKIPDETLDEIYALQTEGKTEEADKLYKEALAKIQPNAEEVLAKIESGEITFTDAIYTYGEDPGMEYYPEGYEVCEGYGGFVEEFTLASMSLQKTGDVSGLVATSYGYHIIEYFSNVPSSVVPYEDVSETLYETLLESNKSARWLELLDQWPEELNLEFKDESLNGIDLY